MTLGDTLKKLRGKLGLTQREVAKKIGVRQNAYSQYETGDREPSLRILTDIANVYKVSPEVFFAVEFEKEINDRLSLEELCRVLQILIYKSGHLFFILNERLLEYKMNVGIPKRRNITRNEYEEYLETLRDHYSSIEKVKELLKTKIDPQSFEEFIKGNRVLYNVDDMEVTFKDE